MRSLVTANLGHHKVRTALAALAVAIGVAMLITMLALSHGTLNEVARRVQTVQADLVVLPSTGSLIYSSGAPLSDKFIAKINEAETDAGPIVKRVLPVCLVVVPDMAGQQQRAFGIDRDDFDAFSGSRKLIKGTLFPHIDTFNSAVDAVRESGKDVYNPDKVPADAVETACEMVIDQRLARAGGYAIGDTVNFLGQPFKICGIVEAGLAGRVFVPIQIVRHIQNAGLARSSMFFVQLDGDRVETRPDVTPAGDKISIDKAASIIAGLTQQRIEPLANYDQMLFASFKSIYVYINIVSAIVLLVSFLFIMVTMYTMVLERRREIGILRSMGAGGRYIMSLTILESLVISLAGTAAGMALATLAKWGIEHYRPLLTVDMQVRWLVLAVVVGVTGGIFSALYPGYRALRADPVECLTYE